MNQTADFLTHPIPSPVLVILAIGALAYVMSRRSPFVCKTLAIASAVVILTRGLAMLKLRGGTPFSWTWVKLTENVSLTVDMIPTTLGMVVVLGSAGFALLITIYSIRAMAGHRFEGKFYAYLIWALAGTCIVGLAGNLLVLLLGWELVTLMLFLMVNQGKGEARAGAAKAYAVLGFSDACLLLAIVLLMSTEGGSANLSLTRAPVVVAQMGAMGYLVYILIMIAALAKAGAVPLHTWIPAIATDAPTPVLAYLPAALDKLLGIYLLAMLSLRMFKPDWTMQVVMMVVGAVTILGAVLMAMMQHNLKRLLSFHAVSQVGYMVLGIGTGTAIGAVGGLFHMINNAIYKSNLFLMSGSIRRATGTDEIEDMGGLGRYLPVTFLCGTISAAAISGVPPFNGFVSKWLIYQGTLQVSGTSQGLALGLMVVAVFGSALTLASFVKVLYSAFLSPRPKGAKAFTGTPRESFLMVVPMIVLAGACVLLGLYPQLIITNVLPGALEGTSVSAALQDIQSGGAFGAPVTTGGMGFWSPTQAFVLILIGIILGLVFLWVSTRKQTVRIVRPFLGGEVLASDDDRFRIPGTHFYQTLTKLPIVGALLEHGEGGAMDPYHWSARHGGALVEMLRSWHTGLINLYVVWTLGGLTITLVYLLVSIGT